jgi:hypothetical protein
MQKQFFFGDYFLAYFGLWSVIHSKLHALHFQFWWYYVFHGMWLWFYLKMWMNTHIWWKYVECLLSKTKVFNMANRASRHLDLFSWSS